MDQDSPEASTLEQERAAFSAVFTPSIADDDESPATVEGLDNDQTAAVAEDGVTRIAGFTEEELRDRLSRIDELTALRDSTRKAHGSIGELKSVVQQLRGAQQDRATPPPAASSPSFEKLREIFPEIVDPLIEDLKGFNIAAGGVSGADEIAALRREIAETNQRNQTQLLAIRHSDWREARASQEFSDWSGTLNTSEYEELNTSWNADVVSGYLDRFKSWHSERLNSTASIAAIDQIKAEKKQRLENAVVPTGTGNPTPSRGMTEIEAFNAVFKNRKR